MKEKLSKELKQFCDEKITSREAHEGKIIHKVLREEYKILPKEVKKAVDDWYNSIEVRSLDILHSISYLCISGAMQQHITNPIFFCIRMGYLDLLPKLESIVFPYFESPVEYSDYYGYVFNTLYLTYFKLGQYEDLMLEYGAKSFALKECHLHGEGIRMDRVFWIQYVKLLVKHYMFDEAEEVCQVAIDNNLQDKTIGGWSSRLERVKKKRRDFTYVK